MEIPRIYKNQSLTIGNDLVNVASERCADQHLKHRFINRVLHSNEQNRLALCRHKNINLWMMWAGKEAAFKAYQKQQLTLIFAHSKFEVDFDYEKLDLAITKNADNFNVTIYGTVKYAEQLFTSIWQVNNKFIHCVSMLIKGEQGIPKNYLNKINYSIFNIDSTNYNAESFDTKLKAKEYLINMGFSEDLEIKRSIIIINQQKRYAPPMLFINQLPCKNIQISLSHDHGLGAIAYIDLATID